MGSLVLLCGFLLLVWNAAVSPLVISDFKRTDLIVINPKTTTNIVLSNLGTRLSSIEEQFKKLSDISQKRDLELKLLINQQKSPDSQNNTQQMTMDGDKERNINDTVKYIQSNEYEEAEKKLLAMGINAEINSIVIEAYSGSETNFGPIIRFAEGLSSTKYSFKILKALANEMQVNGHQDPVKLIALAKALRTKVLIQHLDPDGIKADAEVIMKGLHSNITTIATEYLADAMKSPDYQENSTVHLLADTIDDYDTNVSDDVIEALVHATYDRIESSQILNNIVSHSRINQAISGIISLFGKIKNDGQLNNSAVLDIAFHLSKLRKKYNYGVLSPEKKHDVDKVLKDIPTCARSLFFEQSVCLWNKEQQAYLYAADSTLLRDNNNNRRWILVSLASNNVTSGASWFVEKIGDNIFLKSVKYVNEYLYAAIPTYAPLIHYVFNWIPGNNTDAQSEWNIELHGEYCSIKSAYFNEYLYASQAKFMNSLYAFTTNSDKLAEDSSALWQIRGC